MRKTKAVLRLVKAPGRWKCSKCGEEIKAGQECGKLGSKVICLVCLKKGAKKKQKRKTKSGLTS